MRGLTTYLQAKGGSLLAAGLLVLVGAGAVLVGGITVGDYAKIGAGAVVCFDVPAHATVVAQQPRVIVREEEP